MGAEAVINNARTTVCRLVFRLTQKGQLSLQYLYAYSCINTSNATYQHSQNGSHQHLLRAPPPPPRNLLLPVHFHLSKRCHSSLPARPLYLTDQLSPHTQLRASPLCLSLSYLLVSSPSGPGPGTALIWSLCPPIAFHNAKFYHITCC